ncbi:hypothetical protein Pth03_26910 [Planotetraspora thailandica]|uniref:Uncharacterized protein n=1 Tax=Planotetraspora thailandica TaxID=487172 RepID=A0A8J3UZ85_9ACTN|nr:hypothetical protein Pth03_26910 [Planotetraspora thailandica]
MPPAPSRRLGAFTQVKGRGHVDAEHPGRTSHHRFPSALQEQFKSPLLYLKSVSRWGTGSSK